MKKKKNNLLDQRICLNSNLQTYNQKNDKTLKDGIDCGFFIIYDASNTNKKKEIEEFWRNQRHVSEEIRNSYDNSEETKYDKILIERKNKVAIKNASIICDRILNTVIYEESKSICYILLDYPKSIINKLKSYKSFLYSQSFISNFV